MFKIAICAIVHQELHYCTDLANSRFKVSNETSLLVSKEEGERMASTHRCQHGPMYQSEDGAWDAGKKVTPEYSYWKIGWQLAEETNCLLLPTKIMVKPGSDRVRLIEKNSDHCKYSDGNCTLANGEMLIWDTRDPDMKHCNIQLVGLYEGGYKSTGWRKEGSSFLKQLDSESLWRILR